MVPLIFVLIFGAVALGASYAMQPREDTVRRRIYADVTANERARDRRLEGGPFGRLLAPSLRSLGRRLSALLPQNFVASIERMLIMANDRTTVSGFFGIWGGTVAASLLVIVALVRVNPEMGGTRLLVLSGTVVGLAALIPPFLLRRRAARRRKKIERALPDALDLLVTCVEVGMGVDAAFAVVVEKTGGPLAECFTEYLRHVGLGRSRREALMDVAQRSGAEPLISLATAVNQATEVGTSMGDVLRLQASELRAERKMKAQIAAEKAPVWMVIPLALCFIPAMVAVIIVPSVLNLIRFVGDLSG